jgi:hypothetical protein
LDMSCSYWFHFCAIHVCTFSFVHMWYKKMPQRWLYIQSLSRSCSVRTLVESGYVYQHPKINYRPIGENSPNPVTLLCRSWTLSPTRSIMWTNKKCWKTCSPEEDRPSCWQTQDEAKNISIFFVHTWKKHPSIRSFSSWKFRISWKRKLFDHF